MPRDPSVFVHERALCESDQVGPGTRVHAFAHVMPGASIGRDCNICGQVFVERGARIGDRVTIKNNVMVWDKVEIEDDVFLGPNVVLTNDLNPRAAFKKPPESFLPTRIARGSTIGANATIVCGLTIGRCAFVGAGAVVTRDVPAHALVFGNPARHRGWVCACGEKLPASLQCACGRRYKQAADAGLEEAASPA